MKSLLVLFSCLCSCIYLEAQNFIENPSFELLNEIPTQYTGTFSKFNRKIKFWSSPNQGSPDILCSPVLHKIRPKRPKIDLTKYQPRTGKVMAGIKTYGCASGTLHCKEYLQIKSKYPIRAGKEFYYELWVMPVDSSIRVNAFGVALSKNKIQDLFGVGRLDIYPAHVNDTLMNQSDWQKVSGVFQADDDYEYIIFGNFYEDDIVTNEAVSGGLDYSYYLIDDILVKPLYPEDMVLETDSAIVLNNVHFELNSAILQSASFPQLDQLVTDLQNNKSYSLSIFGHTDDLGTTAYNLSLSEKRASAVAAYLIEKGIRQDRITTKGMGNQFPISDNTDEISRQLNRRVEIKYLSTDR